MLRARRKAKKQQPTPKATRRRIISGDAEPETVLSAALPLSEPMGMAAVGDLLADGGSGILSVVPRGGGNGREWEEAPLW